MLIGLNSAKLLLYGVNVVHFSNDHMLLHVAAFSTSAKTNFPWNSWMPFFKCLKWNLGLMEEDLNKYNKSKFFYE